MQIKKNKDFDTDAALELSACTTRRLPFISNRRRQRAIGNIT